MEEFKEYNKDFLDIQNIFVYDEKINNFNFDEINKYLIISIFNFGEIFLGIYLTFPSEYFKPFNNEKNKS